MDENQTEIITRYTSALSKKEPAELGKLLQQLYLDKFEYEQAKVIVEHYELFGVDHNNAMIAACENILNEKKS